ncbi:MAG TPA: riboflavin synthase [Rhodospirillaceae bacterium]|jgi:riboflavin synthase|nr:riboflavin synthase [Magnetovibrio sp.]HBT44145.1 riboflavin synthase [Rhodospirillaceae bacterium]HCS70758.1 riboflavin synthase [Rhodospirillaceae bacterium]|tara:strand:+ start:122 stop:721 length:600 start_codon:yes stop_codon:yes gene_type:complete
MFTGIITDVGRVRAIQHADDGRLEIETAFDTGDIAIGASVACSGCCLTVIEKGAGWLAFEASGETRRLTTLGTWHEGTTVNLERALKAGDELGGHIVSGHVDGMAELVARETEGESLKLTFRAPDALAPFIAAKGSVTLDGVSLTVNTALARDFTVNIIPHTQEQTTLGGLAVGGAVNLEIDMLARYVARLMQTNGEAP